MAVLPLADDEPQLTNGIQVLVDMLSCSVPVVVQALKALRLLADTSQFLPVIIESAFEILVGVVYSPSVPAAKLAIFGVLMKLVREPRVLKRLIQDEVRLPMPADVTVTSDTKGQ